MATHKDLYRLESLIEEDSSALLLKKTELQRIPKGSLVVSTINGERFVYRRYRKDGISTSAYIGKEHSLKHMEAIKDRQKLLLLKSEIKVLESTIKANKKKVRVLRRLLKEAA